MHSPSLAMPRAWAALLLAARWAAGSRQEDVLAVSRAAAASQELLASQPGCSEAAAGTGSTQALRSCVDSLQRYLTEVSAQSARSHTANARYAADMQVASSLLRRLQDEQRTHASRFEALGQQLRASAELDHGAGAGATGAPDLAGGAGATSPNPGLLQSQATEAAHVALDARGRLHASRQPGPPARGLLQGEERMVAVKERLASPGLPREREGGAGQPQGGAGPAKEPLATPEDTITNGGDTLARPASGVASSERDAHLENEREEDIPAQHYDKDTATDAGSDALTSAASGSASGVGRESEEEEGEREDPTPETLAAPDVLSTTGPSVNEEAKIVKELHRETQKAASTAGRLLEAERDGEGTIQSLEADLRRKKHQLEALRAQLDEQRQAFEKAEQANYRSGNETARHRETLAKLEAENQRAHQVHAHELRKLQDLEQHAKAAADAGEAARTSAEKTVKAVTAKKDELRSAINRLNDLQDQLAELRGGSASAQAAPPQDNRSWMERILG